MKKKFLTFLAILGLLGILVAAGYFRTLHINDQGLWLDEGVTYYNSSAEGFKGVWEKTAALDQSPPGYYFITYPYLKIVMENEFGFRLIPVIFGILSVLMIYSLMTKMFNRGVGLMAALFLAISSFHIGFSIESRQYILISLEALIGFHFLYRAMTAEKFAPGSWIIFTLASIAGLYTHNFYMFILLALGVVFLILLIGSENKLKKIFMGLTAGILTVIAYLPWIPSLRHQLSVDRYWMAENSFSNIKEYLLDFTQQNPYLFWGLIVFSLLAIIFSIFPVKGDDYKKKLLATLSLVAFLVVGLGAPLILSIVHEPILKIRYVVYLLPICFALAAVGLYKISKVNKLLPLPFLIAAVFLTTPWQASAYPVENNEDFRGLVAHVKANPAPIVVHTPSASHAINFYNRKSIDIFPVPFTDDLRKFNIDESYYNKFLDLSHDLDEYYLVITHTHEDPHGLLRGWSNEICIKETELEFSGMETFFYQDCRSSLINL